MLTSKLSSKFLFFFYININTKKLNKLNLIQQNSKHLGSIIMKPFFFQ